METTLTKTKTRNLAKEFANATLFKDMEKLKNLLANDGIFEVPDKYGEAIEVKKDTFLMWYHAKLLLIPITNISYDQCIFCNIGNPVVLFNQGTFPLETMRLIERSKAGLSLEIKEDKIIKIIFCKGFLKTENPSNLECPRE